MDDLCIKMKIITTVRKGIPGAYAGELHNRIYVVDQRINLEIPHDHKTHGKVVILLVNDPAILITR